MKNTFIKLITMALFTIAAASARADAVTQSTILNAPAGAAFLLGQPTAVAPAALALSTTGPLTDPAGEAFAASSILSSPSDDLGYYPLTGTAGFAASPARALETFSANGPKVSVPLPEPSSGTALYFLSGVAGLALVVLRRRTLV